MNGLKQLSELSYSAYQQYMHQTNPAVHQEEVTSPQQGYATLVDINTNQTLSHWKAHSSLISRIKFSPSKLLIVTCSTASNSVLVWQTPLRTKDQSMRPRCLNKLERGYPPSMIEDIAFSRDDRLVSITTAKGTSHLYLIHPSKPSRQENVVCQKDASQSRVGVVYASIYDSYPTTEVVCVHPIARVKQLHALDQMQGVDECEKSSEDGSLFQIDGVAITNESKVVKTRSRLITLFVKDSRSTMTSAKKDLTLNLLSFHPNGTLKLHAIDIAKRDVKIGAGMKEKTNSHESRQSSYASSENGLSLQFETLMQGSPARDYMTSTADLVEWKLLLDVHHRDSFFTEKARSYYKCLTNRLALIRRRHRSHGCL
jgi:hypothetical protein